MPSPSAGLPPILSDGPYRAIVEQMGDGVGTLSIDGLLLYTNPRLAELLDRPGESLLGRPLAELIPPSQRACLDRLRKVSPGRTECAELVGLQQARAIDQARLTALLMSSSKPQILLDIVQQPGAALPDFVCAAANDAACRRYGLTQHELVGRRLLEALPDRAAVGLVALCHRALESECSMAWVDLDEPSGADTEERRTRIRVDRVGDVLGCSWSEVESNSRAHTQQRHQQRPGLVSRSKLLQQLSQHHPPSHCRTQPLALALCHLRDLRTIHDGQGTESAAMVLQAIEERLRRVLPPNTILARINIDQLLVVLGGINNHAEAEATAETIQAMVAQPLPNQGAWITITSRVTMTLEQPGDHLEDLISSALQ